MIRLSLILLAILALSILASACLRVHDLTLVLSVVWPAAGIVAGVLIGAVAFVVQSMPSIQERVIRALRQSQARDGYELTKEQESALRDKFAASMKEIRQNVTIVLTSLAVLAVATWWAYADLPYATWPIWVPLSKLQVIHAIALFMFGVILFAAWDTLQSMFLLSTLDSESLSVPDDDIPNHNTDPPRKESNAST